MSSLLSSSRTVPYRTNFSSSIRDRLTRFASADEANAAPKNIFADEMTKSIDLFRPVYEGKTHRNWSSTRPVRMRNGKKPDST